MLTTCRCGARTRSVCGGGGDSPAIKVVVLNPHVPKEKLRMRGKLDTFCAMFSDVVPLANPGNTAQQWQAFKDLRFQFGVAVEETSKNATSAEVMKNTNLDWLLTLELNCDAPYEARKEGMWLLKHFYPAEHAYVHLDGQIVALQLEEVRKGIQKRVSDCEDIPSAFNLHQARQLLLGAAGRHHMESKLLEALEKVCIVMDQFCKGEVTEYKVSEIINSQLPVLQNLMCKRSLIGCWFLGLNDETKDDSEPENENEEEDSGHEGSVQGDSEDKFAQYEDEEDVLAENEAGNAFQHEDEEYVSDSSESSVNSSIKEEPESKEETPISASSFVSTHSETSDADFSLLLKLEFPDEECPDEECSSDQFPDYDHPTDKTCMNEVIDKYNPHSENQGEAEGPSLDLNISDRLDQEKKVFSKLPSGGSEKVDKGSCKF